MARQRYELHSTGFNPFLELVGGDSAGTPYATGICIPALAGIRYRALLAVVDLDAGDALVGMRTYSEIWAMQSSPGDGPTAPFYIFRCPIYTPSWNFIDGFQTYTLTFEKTPPASHRYNALEQPSFAYEDSNTPAMLFEAADFLGGGFVVPGYLGLTGYTPPGMRGTVQLCWRDNRRFPWDRVDIDAMRYIADGSTRVRLYYDVLQTDPATRFNPDVSSLNDPTALVPEDRFVLNDFPTTAVYGMAAASLIVEKRDRNRHYRKHLRRQAGSR